ncbi:hypothetical protein AX16_010825, partial [Volvariella volvacea WC 439]
VFDEDIVLKWKTKTLADRRTQNITSAMMDQSDTAVPPEVMLELRSAVRPLEDIPDKDKNWHPGSDGKVLDLVHPSLFPLLYGKSRNPQA